VRRYLRGRVPKVLPFPRGAPLGGSNGYLVYFFRGTRAKREEVWRKKIPPAKEGFKISTANKKEDSSRGEKKTVSQKGPCRGRRARDMLSRCGGGVREGRVVKKNDSVSLGGRNRIAVF